MIDSSHDPMTFATRTTRRLTSLPDGSLRIFAPAKLNLGLIVYPPRADGFHDIESWFVPISLYDTLTIRPAAELSLRVTGICGNVTANLQDNLVGRAALLLSAETGHAAGADIHLHKVVPAGGGLGGGSSDAAATLLALNQLWRTDLSCEALANLAARLGSDVPFFIHCESAVCRGRGEKMTRLPFYDWLYAVLFMPPIGVATKAVYQRFDQRQPAQPDQLPDWAAIARLKPQEMASVLTNDLQVPAFDVEPRLDALSGKLAQLTGRKIQMSGSGSTLFILAESAADAQHLRDAAEAQAGALFTAAAVRVYRSGEWR